MLDNIPMTISDLQVLRLRETRAKMSKILILTVILNVILTVILNVILTIIMTVILTIITKL